MHYFENIRIMLFIRNIYQLHDLHIPQFKGMLSLPSIVLQYSHKEIKKPSPHSRLIDLPLFDLFEQP